MVKSMDQAKKSKISRRDLLSCIPLMAASAVALPATAATGTAGGAGASVATAADGEPQGDVGRRVGIALGAGGANGLAHIAMLEVLDDLNVRPHRIAGASIGAVVGAMYASGMPAVKIREQVDDAFTKAEPDDLNGLVSGQVLEWLDLVELELGNGGLLDSQRILSHFYRSLNVETFSELEIPLEIVAADLWEKEQVVLDSGPLLPAVQASMAIPGVFEPVVVDDRVLIDGGTVNPVPWDLLFDDCDIVVGIDVNGVRSRPESNEHNYFQILFNSINVMQKAIVAEKLRHRKPDILISPQIKDVRALEFYAADKVFEQSRSAAERLRSELAALIDG
jgi:NTE family protein